MQDLTPEAENGLAKRKREVRAALQTAKEFLRGKQIDPDRALATARTLKNHKQFSYARRVLARSGRDERLDNRKQFRRAFFQEWALCTYKDTDLPADDRLDDALRILRRADDIETTVDQETLGLMGAIYKRKWEVDNQKRNLELSLMYYSRGMQEGTEKDDGYCAINAAYLLDIIAHIEESEAAVAFVKSEASRKRKAKAAKIRKDLLDQILPGELQDFEGDRKTRWWCYAIVAEASFGLRRYDEAVNWLKKGDDAIEFIPEWEKESTIRQLASLAQIQSDVIFPATAVEQELIEVPESKRAEGFEETRDLQGQVQPSPEETRAGDPHRDRRKIERATGTQRAIVPERQYKNAWEALEKLFDGDLRAVRSAFNGKIGLALSGGGFRASLFHIGTLAKLADLDVLRHVEVLSCVSGGSIVGAHYYLEVRNLLQTKLDHKEVADDEEAGAEGSAGLEKVISKEDYISLVKKISRDFLSGVERNIRTRVVSSWISSAKMGIFPNYSRTTRLGELYEKELYSRVKDGEEKQKRYISGLYIHPLGEVEDFHPRRHNWRRSAKVPDLIINATTLNTGHVWQFTSSWMGETPTTLKNEIDKNDRLRRMYYEEAPPQHQNIRLGDAVAASSCVPAAFEPLTLKNLYPDRIVRLVDGGVCDNQGIAGLLEQDCSVILVSDASGQMDSENYPSDGILGVPLRSNSILQARIRDIQFNDLQKRESSTLLRGLMFIHLKDGIDSKKIDWIDCPEPYQSANDTRASDTLLTPYGLEKQLQARLAAIRTDLDSFSEVEAYALMTSAYRMTEHAFESKPSLRRLVPDREAPSKQGCGTEGGGRGIDYGWDFLQIEGGMKGVGKDFEQALFRLVMERLGTSSQMAFRVWRQSRPLLAGGVAAAVIGFLSLLYFTGILETFSDWIHVCSTVVSVLAVIGVVFLVFYISRRVNWLGYLFRVLLALVMLGPGWLLSKLHLYSFDKLFLRLGRLPESERRKKSR